MAATRSDSYKAVNGIIFFRHGSLRCALLPGKKIPSYGLAQ